MTHTSQRKGPGRPALFSFTLQLAVIAFALGFSTTTVVAQIQPAYLYSLSTFSGPLRYEGVRLYVDHERDETYLLYQNIVRVFNASGMEIFSFGDDLQLGQIVDLAVDEKGDIVLLTARDGQPLVTRCNFRGEPVAPIEIRGLPEGVTFAATRMIYQGGQYYFVSLGTSSVIVTDAAGVFRKSVEFLPLIEEGEKQKTGAQMDGFDVDKDGSMFFTMPTMFKVFKYSPDGTLASFGRPGSAAGRFGVIAGVTTDSHGNVLVVDKLKCVVMAFDKNFTFLGEFGYRGARPQNLIAPDDIAIDAKDRIYVSQGRRRGVSVFALNR